MILVDKNIKELVDDGKLIISGYNEKNINSMSYDLTIDYIIKPSNGDEVEEVNTHTLEPNEFVFIKTKEQIEMPENLLGRIAEKNSLMRMGIQVSGPHYQPGHKTYCFLRVYNMSYSKIKLKSGQSVAQIIFEELKERPDTPYNMNSNSSFNNEDVYRGYAKYKSDYDKRIEKMEEIKLDIENKEGSIYSNILTFMGIFVSVFSLITINFEAVLKMNISINKLIVINLSLTLVITIFIGLILTFIKKKDNRAFAIFFSIFLIIISILNLVAIFKMDSKDIESKSNEVIYSEEVK